MPHSAAKALPLSTVRLLTETTSTPLIFLSAFTWITPMAPVPARQIFIECALRVPRPRPPGASYCNSSSDLAPLLFDQPRRVRHRHGANLGFSESRIEEPLGKHREALGDRRIDRLAEVGRDHGARDARFPDVRERQLPRRLRGVGRREAVFDERAEIGELALLVAAQTLRGKLGVRYDDLPDADFLRRADKREDLRPAQMA